MRNETTHNRKKHLQRNLILAICIGLCFFIETRKLIAAESITDASQNLEMENSSRSTQPNLLSAYAPHLSAAQRFNDLDKNKDGHLSLQESIFSPSRFQELDANTDNKIAAMEWSRRKISSMPPALDQTVPIFEFLDVNGNKKISKHEMKSAGDRFRRIDTNMDGVLEQNELRNYLRSPDARRAHRWVSQILSCASVLKQMDTNKNGHIELSEYDGPEEDFLKWDTSNNGSLCRDELYSNYNSTRLAIKRNAKHLLPASKASPDARISKFRSKHSMSINSNFSIVNRESSRTKTLMKDFQSKDNKKE